MEVVALSRIGLAGMAVMGQNLALNVAEKGFPISVYNHTTSKVDETLDRAHRKDHLPLSDHYTPRDFVLSIQKPRSVIILVKAGSPVDQTIAALVKHMEPGDTIIDGGNEWYENTERRIIETESKGLLYLGMGVADYIIKKESTLHLVLRLRGGANKRKKKTYTKTKKIKHKHEKVKLAVL